MKFFLIILIVCISFCSNLFGKVLNEDKKFTEEKIERLIRDLNSFKQDKRFHQVGFAVCCKYNKWLKDLEKMREDKKIAPFNGAALGYLRLLGTEYLKSKGTENKDTKLLNDSIEEMISLARAMSHNTP